MSEITAKTFDRALANALKGAASMRAKVQELLGFGLTAYNTHDDAGYFTRLVLAAENEPSLPHVKIRKYILGHTDLAWGEGKDGKMRFARSKKPERTENLPMTTPWWEWGAEKAEKAAPSLDINARMHRLLNDIKAAKGSVAVDRAKLREQIRELDILLQPELVKAAA